MQYELRLCFAYSIITCMFLSSNTKKIMLVSSDTRFTEFTFTTVVKVVNHYYHGFMKVK